MRTALTIGYPHKGKKAILLADVEVPIQTQIEGFKALLVKGQMADSNKLAHSDYRRVEIWESDGGRTKARDFVKPQS
jgi:hypothetical protein